MSVTSQLRGWGKEIAHRVQKRVTLRNFDNRTPTIVYQMGKVGSSTVVRTLGNLPLSTPIVRVHSLHPAKVSEDIETLRESLGYLREHVVTSSTLVQKQLDWGDSPAQSSPLPASRLVARSRSPFRTGGVSFQKYRTCVN